jgi:16S rRNA (adenine1518-N6/adenine1519-N6)-dimethyltransferase
MAADPPFDPDTDLLDQHFLNPALARTFVEGASIGRDDVVLDLGAGTGVITTEILRSRPRHTIGIEADRRCKPALTTLATRWPSLTVRFGRIQGLDRVDLTEVTMIVANPPFSTLEHIARLIRGLPALVSADLCVSRSWASSVIADPSTDRYSLSSLSIQTRFAAELVELIPGSSFTPAITRPAAWLRLNRLPHVDPLLDLVADIALHRAGTRIKDLLRSRRFHQLPASPDRIKALVADPWIRSVQQQRFAALSAAQLAQLVRTITATAAA